MPRDRCGWRTAQAAPLNQVQNLKALRLSEKQGDFHVPETLAHAPGCIFTVVQEKVSQVSENLRGELSQARRRRGWQCQVMKYSFGFLFLFFSNLLWNEHSKLCHHNLQKAAWFLHGNGWSCFYQLPVLGVVGSLHFNHQPDFPLVTLAFIVPD